jgi:peptidoglycan/LPS O-acetylase OafA/YrhL
MARAITDSVPFAHAGSRDWLARIVAVFKGRSLAECVDGDRDNILHLRLMAALMVVLGHSSLASPGVWHYDPVNWILPQIQVHVTGLMIFFMISGLLITLSYQRRPDLLRFARARLLRLWPALVVCTATWAFVLGPLLTDVPLSEYFGFDTANSPYSYALGGVSLFGLKFRLPGMFNAGRMPGSVNSSLWTIPVEATMYAWVAGAGVLRLLKFPWFTSSVIAAIFSVLILWPMYRGGFSYMAQLALVVQGFFGAGAIACLLRKYIPVSTGLMVVLAIVCLFASHTRHALPVIWLTIGYFVLWFSYVPRLPSIPHDADLSYGVYLWAWPLQQAALQRWNVHEPLILFAIVTPPLLIIAAASWIWVEKPALRLKDASWFKRRTSLSAEAVTAPT